ncbi:hypothetical protein EXIGLDRAFT_170136 [Exidia glandulosa HHB12029]|uniref:Uncharacterized protein n=1 Tax=Exidia glandulosa HHB12029 TaxID=1314781 RepID=A0A165FBI9_EXIGL|nr:hypothetical protein EXIGLDRAFT_170136 [Exidia glandulosa HHB12029]
MFYYSLDTFSPRVYKAASPLIVEFDLCFARLHCHTHIAGSPHTRDPVHFSYLILVGCRLARLVATPNTDWAYIRVGTLTLVLVPVGGDPNRRIWCPTVVPSSIYRWARRRAVFRRLEHSLCSRNSALADLPLFSFSQNACLQCGKVCASSESPQLQVVFPSAQVLRTIAAVLIASLIQVLRGRVDTSVSV